MRKALPPDKGLPPNQGQFLIYESEDDQVKIDVRLEDETVWLSQQLMAELFQSSQQNISLHIQNIYEEGELAPKATHKKYLSVRREGNREVQRQLDYYNIDMIISVPDICRGAGHAPHPYAYGRLDQKTGCLFDAQ